MLRSMLEKREKSGSIGWSIYDHEEGMKKNSHRNCVFCDIVRGKTPSYRIYEDEFSMALLDIHPFAPGHCLVISKRHVPWWHDLSEEETKSLFRVSRIVARRIKKSFHPDFVCLYARGRRIPHTHLFLVPTYSCDLLDRFFNALEKAQEFPGELSRFKSKKAMAAAAKRLRKD
jgi:histidine triad (HIT) family protein